MSEDVLFRCIKRLRSSSCLNNAKSFCTNHLSTVYISNYCQWIIRSHQIALVKKNWVFIFTYILILIFLSHATAPYLVNFYPYPHPCLYLCLYPQFKINFLPGTNDFVPTGTWPGAGLWCIHIYRHSPPACGCACVRSPAWRCRWSWRPSSERG